MPWPQDVARRRTVNAAAAWLVLMMLPTRSGRHPMLLSASCLCRISRTRGQGRRNGKQKHSVLRRLQGDIGWHRDPGGATIGGAKKRQVERRSNEVGAAGRIHRGGELRDRPGDRPPVVGVEKLDFNLKLTWQRSEAPADASIRGCEERWPRLRARGRQACPQPRPSAELAQTVSGSVSAGQGVPNGSDLWRSRVTKGE